MFLNRNIFSRARLQLVTMYAIIFLVMVTLTDLIVGYNRTQVLKDVIHTVINDPEIDSTILTAREEALSDLAPWKYSLFLLLCLIVSSVAYMLANRSLKPITEVVASQRRFIANASHELRTPLSVMKAQAEVALRMKDQLPKEEIEKALRVVLAEVEHMSGTIDTLLRISNNVHSTKSIPLSKIAVKPSIEKALALLGPAGSAKNVTLAFVCQQDSHIDGNVVALEGVLMNLLKNAISYTAPEGKIEVTLDRHQTNCRITIADTGIGISQKDFPHIFNPFFRSEDAKRLDRGGSGLGLTLVKELIEAHNGSISITSEPHEGTEITILFPVRS